MLSKRILFFIFILFFFACKKEGENTESPFYDFPNDKLWRHRVNCIEIANNYAQKFPGIEIDLYYVDSIDGFICDHGEVCAGIPLRDLLLTIENRNEIYYWFDFKNSNTNSVVDASVSDLENILIEFDIKEKSIVESQNPYCIQKYRENDFYTSYWIPHISEDTKEERERITKIIQGVIDVQKPTVLSASYKMFSFLKKNFPNEILHFWTNGLITEGDKRTINKIKNYNNAKVILVDYSEPF